MMMLKCFVSALLLSAVCFAADVVVTDKENKTTVVKDAGFYLGPISGYEMSGVQLKQGTVNKTIPWGDIKQVEFLRQQRRQWPVLPEGRVRVSRINAAAVEGDLVIHAMQRNLVGKDSDGTPITISVSNIKLIEPVKSNQKKGM
jgi:hypothetical protein